MKSRMSVRLWLGIIGLLSLALMPGAASAGLAPRLPQKPLLAPNSPGDWPMYGHDVSRTNYNPDETTINSGNVGQLIQRWQVNIGTNGTAPSGAPSVADGKVFVGSSVAAGNNFFAFDAVTGGQAWSANINYVSSCFNVGIGSTSAISGTILSVGGGDSAFYGLDTNSGAQLWRNPMNLGASAFPWESPLMAFGRSYLGMASRCDNPSVRGEVRAVDIYSGTQQAAQYFVPSGQAGAGIWNSPALSPDGSTLVVATGEDYNGFNGPYNRAMVSLDPISLSILQSFQQGTTGGDVDFGTTPVIFHDNLGRILVGANHKNGVFYTYVLNNISAGPIWSRSTGTNVGMMPAYDPNFGSGGTLFIGGSASRIFAVDPATGTDRWPAVTLSTMHGNMAIANGLIFVNLGTTGLRILAESNGSTLRTIVPASAGTSNSGVAVSNGFIYWLSGSFINAWSLPGGPTSTPTNTPTITQTRTRTSTPTITRTNTPVLTSTPTSTPTPDCAVAAFHYLSPQEGGPENGGTVTVGDKFVFDLMVEPGLHTLSTQQAYLTFTYPLLQNVSVTQPGCIVTNTVTADTTNFDFVAENEACNAPSCASESVPPGIAFASFAGNNPPYSGPNFRVAQIGLCASAPGTAVIHWQFSPPAPITRDTDITDENSLTVNTPFCYVDYVIDIVSPTPTPELTQTNTPVNTPTDTATNTPTHTFTPTPAAMLVGHVTWQGRPTPPHPRNANPITLTLRLQSGGPDNEYTGMSTDDYGFFTVTVSSLPTGTYNWRVKDPKYLASSGAASLAGASVTNVEMGLQLAADCDNNNVVNSTDFSILRGTFGKGFGDPGYDDRGDLDGSLVVNSTDFNLLRGNFGVGGAPPIHP